MVRSTSAKGEGGDEKVMRMATADSSIILYQSPDGSTSFEVRLDQETVWLSQAEMVSLFNRDQSVISRHVRNVFRDGELDEKSNMQKMHFANSDKPVAFYNLDVIISVGYRVKSQQGTRFRQWATRVLKEHIVKGYTVNEQRLKEESARLQEMRRTMELLARTLTSQELVSETGRDVLRVISDYAYALTLLDRYDHGTLAIEETTRQTLHVISYDEAMELVSSMKGEFDGLFGVEKDQGFRSALGAIYQTFGGEELYPSVEEKGANLLYFVVKNHAFSDGNKRIAAALFIYFLGMNGILYRPDGGKRLADNALVALTLLIAESRPDEKETIVKVIVNLINRKND
jgi:prophage maintenance system killer protein